MADDKITDLNDFRNAKAEPDADCMSRDEYGRPLYTFLAEYMVGDKQFGLDFLAYDEAEAHERIEGMKASLQYTGKLYSKIPL